ncbi:MAG: bifunctional diaminohydroxyphosphoribosylaminopyrimidine deaminase/5-amino-6-(5-phosphoribosylamino)uracil reductase RibD [Candidatus Omnitrophica bacterium]|nr:bifunctional diaminohydroxyphosphoribosylaminopyrimidine deaminase/5-amino-6-(5-phosphoribosylamino)uracil reductase RibD [Candidatus Omnitrophota bacterium]
MQDDKSWMMIAIKEAEKGRGKVEPNPVVGAVIVEDDQMIAHGFHARYGGPHAEVNAIDALGRPPQDSAILYVTLEPCSTEGKTGKCTEYIIQSGIKEVVIGAIDPNPEHRGRGVEILKEAGIRVRTGVLEDQCRALNPEFNKRMGEGD